MSGQDEAFEIRGFKENHRLSERDIPTIPTMKSSSDSVKPVKKDTGHAEEEEFWGITGLLHDIDFELYPEEHCKKAPELLREAGVGEDMIYAVCSHGYGICSEDEPKLEMEKVLFAADELTGLIWSCALMRPSKSTMDMEVKSLKKKFKDKKFAAGCSRDVISQGAEMLGWELDELFDRTIQAMRSCEASVAEFLGSLT